MITSPSSSRRCSICGKAIDLETCKTDERGNAVHGQCYAAKLAFATAAQMSEKSANSSFEVNPVPHPDGDGSTPELKYPEWQKPYHEALLETDHARLRQKVLAAEAAVFKRRQQLLATRCDGDVSQVSRTEVAAELTAIGDALCSLNILRGELAKNVRSAS